jgi:hypothetical protein
MPHCLQDALRIVTSPVHPAPQCRHSLNVPSGLVLGVFCCRDYFLYKYTYVLLSSCAGERNLSTLDPSASSPFNLITHDEHQEGRHNPEWYLEDAQDGDLVLRSSHSVLSMLRYVPHAQVLLRMCSPSDSPAWAACVRNHIHPTIYTGDQVSMWSHFTVQ